ncbi:N-methylhydantoinase A [Desulfosarcina ovata subsp. sediminis]|uniref:N-methylhydantoinase A n=1 Tax=Desulfosarcina ovata subsp. sediminis TaxID=885957 RepID=A0A5K7ZYK4_9BACT|nr:hydantoinase/oxoprolinase family protein [Desulfosarcina ovata]BBO85224.1 N-methylhydantoinase A [Desulfosarcina ovata subsp. sediminis]
MTDVSGKHISKIGVDLGGTFTDLFSYDAENKTRLCAKVPSTPDDFTRGVLGAIEDSGVNINKIDYFIHGTTIATNAAIEKTYGVTPFITTKGFRDFTLIGKYHRESLFDPYQKKPEPLVKRRHIFEITGRLDSSGNVVEPLDAREIESLAQKIREMGVSSVAVGLLNSYANPSHEEEVKAILEKNIPNLFVSLSSTIPKFRALGRFSTAIMRACLQPVVKKYLDKLHERLNEKGFRGRLMMVTNNGGMIDAKLAIERPELLLTSGPASGVSAAMFISESVGNDDLITMDMGGTSCDVSIIEKGQPLITSEYELCFDQPVNVPMLDIRTIGAGGGSIAWIDEGGSLRVGPRSASSFPGPACYGRGGKLPTVTDANIVLGRINDSRIFGKKIHLDVEASKKALESLSPKTGLDLIEIASGILTIVNESMAAALKLVSLDRGRDPREFCLVAFGGAGALHAPFLAQTMGVKKVVIPGDSGIFSAFGAVIMDFKHDYEETFYSPLNEIDLNILNKRYYELDQKSLDSMELQGIDKERIKIYRSSQMRFVGQTYEVETSIPNGTIESHELETITNNFYNEHEKEYGLADRNLPVAFVNLRSTVIGEVDRPNIEMLHANRKMTEEVRLGSRSVYFDGSGFIETEVFDRRMLPVETRVNGPAVIEDEASTTIVAPGMTAQIDGCKNIIINLN